MFHPTFYRPSMATPEEILAVVHDVLGSGGDQTILDYIVGVLEDEHYDHGVDGAETYEHLGPILVSSLAAQYCQ
jgi:hypothetical protein